VSAANKKSLLGRITHGLLLTANAAGRSIQVFDGKLISAFAAVACFFSALAGTLSKQDDHAENSRNTASKISKDSLSQCGYKTDGNTELAQNPICGDSCFPIFSIPPNNPISENELSQTIPAIRHSI
jgi:hypothetical protein